MTNEIRELLILSEASRAIASVRTIDEAKDLRDRAEAVKAYARKARLGQEIFVEASAIKARAERRLGELLRETPLAKSAPGNQHTGTLKPDTQSDACTLESLGLTKSDSSRLQKLASLPNGAFERHIAKMLAGDREVTTASLMRLAKENQPHRKSVATPPRVAPSAKTVSSLSEIIDRGERFSTIYADPPWPYSNQATRAATSNHYQTMSVDAICAEPISKLVADKAHLHLWTTNAFLFDAFNVLEAWGFKYKSCFIWVKPQMGLGNYWRVSHEFLCDRPHKNSYVTKSIMWWWPRILAWEGSGERRLQHIIFPSRSCGTIVLRACLARFGERRPKRRQNRAVSHKNYVALPRPPTRHSKAIVTTTQHNNRRHIRISLAGHSRCLDLRGSVEA